MHPDLDRWTFALTGHLLVAALLLIGLGLAGLGGSAGTVGVLLAVAVVLLGLRDRIPRHAAIPWPAVRVAAGTAWAGPALAVLAALLALGTTPAELQAVGGLVGLAAMANYFLRPLYALVYALVAAGRTADEGRV